MSNGSSSMATTCATSLALMDAGVPVSAPVGGISGEMSPPRSPFLPDSFFSIGECLGDGGDYSAVEAYDRSSLCKAVPFPLLFALDRLEI